MNTGVHGRIAGNWGVFQTKIRDPSSRVEGDPGWESPQISASVGTEAPHLDLGLFLELARPLSMTATAGCLLTGPGCPLVGPCWTCSMLGYHWVSCQS